MPTYPHIERYYQDKERLIEFGGSDNESNIRPAFQNCLAAYCQDHREKLALVPELPTLGQVVPDGTVKDSLRLARGYWEAKDSHDDLDAEIQKKTNQGYPQNNILFEDSRTAVLMRHGTVSMRVDMGRPAELHRLIRTFLDYVLPEVEEFRQAWRQFKNHLPTVLGALRDAVDRAAATSPDYRSAAARFLDHCHRTIGPEVSDIDVREMLLQHILTKDIFLRVFAEDQFHRENNIARQLDSLERTFFTGDLRREAIDNLRPYYGAIGRAADDIADYAEKQHFLKAVYEDFYKVYNPAAADRLGVVYTPNEVVDFIIRGADYLLQKHFGRSLADDNVQILDPATGTGTFITSLISYLPPDRLEYKYLKEIHANEVAILPYYIANLNIEYSYKERTGRYREFPNLCFVDTLDNLGWKGASEGAVERQSGFNLGGLSEENWIRVQEQNEKPISVIIGNPPYNSAQSNFNDFNPNRGYPEVDQRIKDTYVAASAAQKTAQYDMYKRFIRWASDRLDDDGIVAFITNRRYLDALQDDGFRHVVADEFTEIYIIDLGSDVRRNPKISGTTHNVFGIQTGVAVAFFVREKPKLGNCCINYSRRDDTEVAKDKLAFLRDAKLGEILFAEIVPDSKSNWINQSNSDFDKLMPIVGQESKTSKTVGEEQTLLRLYAPGVMTGRDEWVYDFGVHNLRDKTVFFADTYNALLSTNDESYPPSIKWSRDLRNELKRRRRIVHTEANRIESLFRPFITKHFFADFAMNDVLTRNHYEMYGRDLIGDNMVICVKGPAANHFSVLASSKIVDYKCGSTGNGGTFCLPLYRYDDKGKRVSNITEWGIRHINEHYRKAWGEEFDSIYPNGGITAEDIFAYTYAVLHDPVYRHDYAADLLREFPRLPLYQDFDVWARMGKSLLDLHIGFETAEPYPLQRNDQRGAATRVILRADKERGVIALDDKTALTGVPPDAWRYRLGSRSALEWVLDQYKERKSKDPTIAEKFNTYRFADHKERVIDLLQRVCAVSVQTLDIVDDMAYWEGDRLIVFGDRDKYEMAMLGLADWSRRIESGQEEEDEDWLAAWSEI